MGWEPAMTRTCSGERPARAHGRATASWTRPRLARMSSMSGGDSSTPALSGQRRDRHEAPGAALPTVGEEEVGPTAGAEPQQIDSFRGDAGGSELVHVGPPQVDHPLAGALGRRPALPRPRKLPLHPLAHAAVHLLP